MAIDATMRLYLKNYPKAKRTDEVKILLGEELLNSYNYTEAVDILEPIPNKSPSAIKGLSSSYVLPRAGVL